MDRTALDTSPRFKHCRLCSAERCQSRTSQERNDHPAVERPCPRRLRRLCPPAASSSGGCARACRSARGADRRISRCSGRIHFSASDPEAADRPLGFEFDASPTRGCLHAYRDDGLRDRSAGSLLGARARGTHAAAASHVSSTSRGIGSRRSRSDTVTCRMSSGLVRAACRTSLGTLINPFGPVGGLHSKRLPFPVVGNRTRGRVDFPAMRRYPAVTHRSLSVGPGNVALLLVSISGFTQRRVVQLNL